ncbi:hypothetical protein ABFY60_27485 [Lysinibacillus pakistanensis]|uniref:hypothetical protein n=1 Tax=Lysinibacillus pakistanensis TaxID=759811 RepID=UPI003D283265
MRRLKSLPGFYLEVIIFSLMAVDKQKGGQLFLYFFPPKHAPITEQEWAKRLHILDEAANEMDFDEVQKVLSKLTVAYKKAGGMRVLEPDVTVEVVTDRLRRSRNSAYETDLFNTFVQKVAQKVSI